MRLVGGIAAFWFISAAFAQEVATPSRADLARGFSLDAPGAGVKVGYVVAGDATLAPAAVERGAVVVSVPVTHTETGLLQTDVKGEKFSISADTPVFRAVFGTAMGQSDPLLAWCGRGLRPGNLEPRPATVCVLETPDGRATLAGGSASGERAWSADGVRLDDVDARVDRPGVKLNVASPFGPMRIQLSFFSANAEQVTLERSIIGPGGKAGEEERYAMGFMHLARQDGVARREFAAVDLELRVAEDKRTLTAAWRTAAEVPSAATPTADEDAVTAPAPFTFGAVLLDLESFAFTDGPVGKENVLARGKGSRRKVRKVEEPARVQAFLAGILNERVEAGAIFHEVEFFDKHSLGVWTRTATWCGPFDIDTVRGPSEALRCVLRPALGDTYNVFEATPSKTWLSGARYVTFAGQRSIQLRFADLSEDPLGSFDVLLGVSDINRTWIYVGAVARRDGEDVHFWSARARFNEAGEARFPFWDRTLVIRRAGKDAVTGAFEPGGDGAGFYEFDGLLPASGLRLP